MRAVTRPLVCVAIIGDGEGNGGEKAMQSVVIRFTLRDGALLAKVITSYLASGYTCLEPLSTSCGYARYKSWMPMS